VVRLFWVVRTVRLFLASRASDSDKEDTHEKYLNCDSHCRDVNTMV
jgi:hypothetical protein